MAIRVGDQAPDFTLLTKGSNGLEQVSLHEKRGRNVVLLFFPLAGTGTCTKEMCSVSDDWDSYKDLDAEVYGVSVDSPHALQLWAEKSGITVPLLSDFNKEVSMAYGTIYDTFVQGGIGLSGVSKRSAFVIDREGKIVHSEVLDNAGQIPDLDAVKEALRKAG